ncbi:tyrosine-type recombinase/integrase [Sphingorhabdus sp.]|jgi:integrase|uniref:tyrosine-type recombinase/integrase n=1 Tax=Sphingorhabdus sp. TaxID=1902408 RepID=UPI0037C5838E
MAKHNSSNTRIKRDYFQYLKEAMRRDEASIDTVAKALSRFEESNGYKDFGRFHREQAVAFKRKLDEQTSVRTGKPLSRATVHSTLSALKAFFFWLAGQPGYKSKIAYDDANYFNLSDKDVRIANASRQRPVPSLDQINHVLASMPVATDIELRNRALIAFAILTGARDGAIASLRMKHIDLVEGVVHQDARDVRTKASKSFRTWFFPVGGDALEIFTRYCQHLREKLLWGDDDPLFPATLIAIDESGGFAPSGLRRENWKSAAPIREIFKAAFETAGLPYFNPHSFRNTLVQLGERTCTTAETFKAWSQNLGHEQVLTTFTSYGRVAPHRQAALIRAMDRSRVGDTDERLTKMLAETVRNYQSGNY